MFQVSAEIMRSRDKEQNQDQKAVIMADDIERVEEDARHDENEVQKKTGLFSPQNFAIHQSLN